MVEKRKHVRVNSILPLELFTCPKSSHFKRVLTRDLSMGGVKVCYSLPPKDLIRLRILFSNFKDPMVLNSIVAWNKGNICGLKFNSLTAQDQYRLTRFISKHMKTEKQHSGRKIPRFLKSLSRFNAQKATNLVEDIIKLIYYRQERMRKTNLKPKEILKLVDLFRFRTDNAFEKIVKDKLAECFGDISEKEALDYYDKNVMGSIFDVYHRTVIIDEDGMRFLYKDAEGKHVVDSANFRSNRAKRMPWIRYVIENTKEVYDVEEYVGVFYFYVAKMIIPFPKEGYSKPTYFIVVVRKGKDKKLYFKTAYCVDKYNRFLKIIEPSLPYIS